jgi:Flp pilus assembly protein TadG
MRRRRSGERGDVAVEAALTFLLFFTIVIAILEFGWAVYAFNFVSYAAKEGARYAMVRGANSGNPATSAMVTSFVQQEAIALTAANLSVTTTWTPDNNPGSTVSVQVSYTFHPMTAFVLTSPIAFKANSAQTIMQ